MNRLFGNMSITGRLALGFPSILFFSLIAITVSITRMNAVAAATQRMMDEPAAKQRLIEQWYRYAHAAVPRTTAIVVSSDTSLAGFFAEDVAVATKAASV